VLDVGNPESNKADSALDAVDSASDEVNSEGHEADSVHNFSNKVLCAEVSITNINTNKKNLPFRAKREALAIFPNSLSM
jgi:hypothetical protein